MGIESYKSGMSYENFICGAYKNWDNSINGANLSNMRNLIDAENGDACVSHLPKAERQLATVKQYIIKAFDKYLKFKFTDEKKVKLSQLRKQTELATSSLDLMEIIEEGLEVTNELE